MENRSSRETNILFAQGCSSRNGKPVWKIETLSRRSIVVQCENRFDGVCAMVLGKRSFRMSGGKIWRASRQATLGKARADSETKGNRIRSTTLPAMKPSMPMCKNANVHLVMNCNNDCSIIYLTPGFACGRYSCGSTYLVPVARPSLVAFCHGGCSGVVDGP